MKKVLILLMTLTVIISGNSAKEGMWIPVLLDKNIADMQAMGCRLSVEEIYSVNGNSLKDAIVMFGGGCTGEIVSQEGLVLTNHHCGYGSIQKLSSVEHDYLTDGFWATGKDDEIPCPGLSVSLLVQMQDVTDQVLAGTENMSDAKEIQKKKLENIKQITDTAIEKTNYKADVESYFYGNQYFLLIYEVFTDIRFVGAPPSSIGKFGNDTDNWVWPRHTGDFSIFRIYADKNNQPASYSKENIPYKPKNYLKISLDGYELNDFTFVFGYPGNTQEYLPSYAIETITETSNPIRIDLRGKKLDIMNREQQKDKKIWIDYASKNASLANGWKKWIGENGGIERYNGIEKKRSFETTFTDWVTITGEANQQYGKILNTFDSLYKVLRPIESDYIYMNEGPMSVELIRFALTSGFSKFSDTMSENDFIKQKANIKNSVDKFYASYSPKIDKDIFKEVLNSYINNVNPDNIPSRLQKDILKFKGNIDDYCEWIFNNSIFSNKDKLQTFISNYKLSDYNKLQKDPVYALASDLVKTLEPVSTKRKEIYTEINSLMKIYMKAQMEMMANEKIFYPDANFTLRVSYGKIDDYEPKDGVIYKYYTTLDGIIEKGKTGVYDWVVDPKLIEAYNNKDYGRYADKSGELRVCFIASNHTTGGNSGSPVMNGKGELIGLNFDRCWEGTMSDLIYDPDICRNIVLDIRYCLFVIDKVGGAKYLIEEMMDVKQED